MLLNWQLVTNSDPLLNRFEATVTKDGSQFKAVVTRYNGMFRAVTYTWVNSAWEEDNNSINDLSTPTEAAGYCEVDIFYKLENL